MITISYPKAQAHKAPVAPKVQAEAQLGDLCLDHATVELVGPAPKLEPVVEVALPKREVTADHLLPKDVKLQKARAALATTVSKTTGDPRESRVSHATTGSKSPIVGDLVKDPTAAVRRARWRKKNPEQHRDQQRAARARRKAGKAIVLGKKVNGLGARGGRPRKVNP